jgi:hypothetical protein
MLYKRLYIRSLALISTILVLSHGIGYSQGTDISVGKLQHFYIGFSLSPAQSSIINAGSTTISKITSETENTIAGALEAGYSFSKYFSVSSGLGFSSYISDLALDTFKTSYETTDHDTPAENYVRYIIGSNITEVQKISYLKIPLILNFQLPVNSNFGFYLQTGVSFSLPVKKTYSSKGTFTYKGYYQAYNVYITGVPWERLEKDTLNADQGELKIKSFSTEFISSAGVQMSFQNKMQISLGFFYSRLLSDISAYKSSESFILSSIPTEMKSMMEGSTKVTASSFGLRIGFRYYLK